MKFTQLIPSFLLFTPFAYQLNGQIDCCGLAVGTVIQSRSIHSVVPTSQNFGPRSLPSNASPSAKITNSNGTRFQNPNQSVVKQPVRGVFTSGSLGRGTKGFSSSRKLYCFEDSLEALPISSNRGTPIQSMPMVPSVEPLPLFPSVQRLPSARTVYYMERPIKSIRVSSVPDIERWESAMRKNMALNGRNKGKVDELLSRIRDHYDDQTIEAKDYSPDGKGYTPSQSTRNLAESRIGRTVQSMADFFEKSGNPQMDPSKSAGGDSFLKGKLSFVNTELDKLGKPRVSLEELKQVISLQMTGSDSTIAPSDQFRAPGNRAEQAQVVDPGLDPKAVKELVKARYLSFAGWLAENEKKFPSIDPEVDTKTMRTFDLVNADLRKIGKFESMIIFREKTIAYLEDIQDGQIDRQVRPLGKDNSVAQKRETSKRDASALESPLAGRRFQDPFAEKRSVHSHLPLYSGRSLPGKAWSSTSTFRHQTLSNGRIDTENKRSFRIPSSSSLPGKSWDSSRGGNQNGQSVRVTKSVLNNLPGSPI